MTLYGKLLFLFSLFAVSTGHAFDLQGHRGARGLAPENTLPAFSKALAIGVTTLELDLGLTKDGVLIVSHNPRISPALARDRSNGKWLVAPGPLIHSMTFDELQKYDVGRLNPQSRYSARYPDQVPVDGTLMPSLRQLFDLVNRIGNTDVQFNIETKINPVKPDDTASALEFAQAIQRIVAEYNFEDRVVVQSFDWRSLQHIKKLNPRIRTAYLSARQRWLDNIGLNQAGPSAWTGSVDVDDFGGDIAMAIKHAGGDIWSPYHKELTAEKIKAARALGLQVIPWTVNDEARMQALIDMGVDGIITDYPDRLRQVMQVRGIKLPARSEL